MGKKSRRPNRNNKPKGTPAAASPPRNKPQVVIPAAASPTSVAAPQTETATGDVTDLDINQWEQLLTRFNELYESKDWEGVLTLESRLITIAKLLEDPEPSEAGDVYFNLGFAHKSLGREGGIDQAIMYYKKSIGMAKQDREVFWLTPVVVDLAECYIKTGRMEEAMDLHKSLRDENGKESMNPDAILSFVKLLQDYHELSRALQILEEHLDIIESSWENQMQCKAYDSITFLYCRKNDFSKSNVYCERQLSVAKEIKNLTWECKALRALGINYGHIREFGIAMEYLEQALVIASELGDTNVEGNTYTDMGRVLLEQDGRERESIEMFQKACGILDIVNHSAALSETFHLIGEGYTKIGAWDDAVVALEKSISMAESIQDEINRTEYQSIANQALGKTYLEKFYSTDKSLVGIPHRNEILRKALFCSEAAITLEGSKGNVDGADLFLDLAQDHFFLGDMDNAHEKLKEYLDATVKLGPSHCQTCRQTCAKDAHMEKCSVCKVVRYCSRSHSIQSWKKGRLCHKVMCPLLKRWRKLTEGEDNADASVRLFNDFFSYVSS